MALLLERVVTASDAASAADFGSVTPEIEHRLVEIVGVANVRFRPAELEPFASDATPLLRSRPDAVVFPATTQEVSAILRLASSNRIPVVPRGAGTSLAAGAVAIDGGMMPLTRMRAIMEASAPELLAVVERLCGIGEGKSEYIDYSHSRWCC